MVLLTPDGSYDRAAIMREAHRQFRQMRSFGWSFGRCLSFAWAKARAMRALGGVNAARRTEFVRMVCGDAKFVVPTRLNSSPCANGDVRSS